jgi:hypothetical protein
MLSPPTVLAPDTLKGVDDLLRSDLEAFRDLWFDRLLWATGFVFVGLVFEAPEIWHDTVHAIRDLIHSCKPEKALSSKLKLMGTLGWVLIVVGVGGEFVAEGFFSRADGFVQKFDEILLAETTKAAGDAKQSAGDAALASQRAKDVADEAEKELAEYKAKKADRRLTPQQQKSIASQLSFPGQPVDLWWYAGSFEGGGFANDISNALNMAHWNIAMHPHIPGEGTIPPTPEGAVSGLVIFTMPTDRSEEAGKQLHDAFGQAHVPATLLSITAWWSWYAKMPFKRDSLAREDARLLLMVGNHP